MNFVVLAHYFLFSRYRYISTEDKEKSYHHLLHLYHSSLDPDHKGSFKVACKRIRNSICRKILRSNCGCLFVVVLFPASCLAWFLFRIFNSIRSFVPKIKAFLLALWRNVSKYFQVPEFLLDFVTSTFRLSSLYDEEWTAGPVIPNARYLRDTGFSFKKSSSCVMSVTCSRRTIKIPVIFVGEINAIRYKNLIAFEHCSPKFYGNRFTAFATFMDYLIDTEEDVALLKECGIIVNRLGKDEEVASFFGNLRKGIFIEDSNICLFHYVKKYYTEDYHKVKCFQWRKKLIPEYFSNPWSQLSSSFDGCSFHPPRPHHAPNFLHRLSLLPPKLVANATFPCLYVLVALASVC